MLCDEKQSVVDINFRKAKTCVLKTGYIIHRTRAEHKIQNGPRKNTNTILYFLWVQLRNDGLNMDASSC